MININSIAVSRCMERYNSNSLTESCEAFYERVKTKSNEELEKIAQNLSLMSNLTILSILMQQPKEKICKCERLEELIDEISIQPTEHGAKIRSAIEQKMHSSYLMDGVPAEKRVEYNPKQVYDTDLIKKNVINLSEKKDTYRFSQPNQKYVESYQKSPEITTYQKKCELIKSMNPELYKKFEVKLAQEIKKERAEKEKWLAQEREKNQKIMEQRINEQRAKEAKISKARLEELQKFRLERKGIEERILELRKKNSGFGRIIGFFKGYQNEIDLCEKRLMAISQDEALLSRPIRHKKFIIKKRKLKSNTDELEKAKIGVQVLDELVFNELKNPDNYINEVWQFKNEMQRTNDYTASYYPSAIDVEA